MKYLVVEVNCWYTNGKVYDTLTGARRGATAKNKREIEYSQKYGTGIMRMWAAVSTETFRAQDVIMVETRNLMSGKKVMIRKSEQGTCTDPSTERYWSM